MVRHTLSECITGELPALAMLVARSALYLRSATAARQARAAAWA